ncbi:YdeI/OmpD-associated family protein [Listeria costaricensis]|uniref:YdeI/OmpD-associated family protein n=1 Tax=Listeria costaricensis TaxID=2026604 RepID=UPI000C0787A8|nr:YdeI/OmpD-associated family protein [Listeria costaricensis]
MAKTIIEKLNLLKYEEKAVLNQPDDLTAFDGLGKVDHALSAAVEYDLIIAFCFSLSEMKAFVDQVINEKRLSANGYLFFAYPKKGNKRYATYIHRDQLFEGIGADQETGYIENSDLKFSRMVGLDEVFTMVGLKRDAKGKNKKSTANSGRVDDYLEKIPEVEAILARNPKALAFYQSLTKGYQKDWARYIYSAKQESTRLKRQEEMIRLLGEEYKTITHYRQSKS